MMFGNLELIWLLWNIRAVSAITLTISPPIVVHGSDLPAKTIFECANITADDIKSIYVIQLSKISNSGYEQVFAYVQTMVVPKFSTNTAPVTLKKPTAAVVSGGIDVHTSTNSTLRVEFQTNEMTCEDAGTYMCSFTYYGEDYFPLIVESRQEFGVYAMPSNVTIAAIKDGIIRNSTIDSPFQMEVGENITFRCSGQKGNDNFTSLWWRMTSSKTGADMLFNINQSATISPDTGTATLQICSDSWTTTMSYTATIEDSNRTNLPAFMCSASFQPPGHPLYTVNSDAFYISVQDQFSPGEDTATTTGVIVGSSIAGLAVILVVAVVIVIILRRPSSSSGMEEAHRSILRKQRTYILDNVATPFDVAEALFRRDFLTEGMKQKVQAERTITKKMRKLLDIIPKRGPEAFDAFCHALVETKNEYVVDKIRPGWKETQPNPDVGLPGERGRAVQQPPVDLPEAWPNEAAMTAQVDVDPCGVHTQLVKDYWLNPAVYSMRKTCRGRCVIISNQTFYGPLERIDGVMRIVLSARHGTAKDVENLVDLFQQLHFNVVEPHVDKTAEEMFQILSDEARHPAHKDAECFVCIICSHGTTTGIYGKDGEVISLEDITSLFESRYCPALISKPKLMFIQACQGEEKDRGTPPTLIQTVDSLVPQLDVGDAHPEATERQTDNIPTKVDMLVACATHPGYISLRNTQFGSWFIQAVIYVFQRHAHKEDILSLLTLVNNLVARGRTYDNEAGSDIMQAAFFRASLLKKCYFFPGVIQDPDS